VTVPRLHQHGDLFVERNLFLHAVLGGISIARKAEAYLERSLSSEASAPEPAESDETTLLLVLGVLSLGHTLERVVSSWAKQGAQEVSRSLLRAPALEARKPLEQRRGRLLR